MKTTLSILALLCASVAVYAETWSYDPSNPEANIVNGDYIPTSDNLIIDVSMGNLEVTGHFENKGLTTIIGSNSIGSDGSLNKSGYKFIMTSTNQHNRNQLILENVTISSGSFYNERGGGLSLSPLLSIRGYVNFDNAHLVTKQNGTILIEDGSVLEISNGKNFGMENYNGVLKFENARPKSMISSWEFKMQNENQIAFGISNDSLACIDASTAVIEVRFPKALNGIISLDFSGLTLGDDFVAGNTYNVALIHCTSDEVAAGQFDDTWQILAENVIESDVAKFAGFIKNDEALYVSIAAVPEPSTFAAIFATLALILAAYRKRR